MRNMKASIPLDHYQQTIQQMAVSAKHNPTFAQNLLQFIESQLDTSKEEPVFEEFLKGEKAFFSGKYQLALKHYLHTKTLPNFKLYCYRTSAYVSKARGELAKAISFAKEALAISPIDYPSLMILEELLMLDQQHEEAQLIRLKIDGIDTAHFAIHHDHNPEKSDVSSLEIPQPESDMHIPPGFLSSLDTQPSASTEHLTHRLYALKPFSAENIPFTQQNKRMHATLVNPTYPIETTIPSSKSLSKTIHGDIEHSESLEQSIKIFQKRQEACIAQYLEQLKRRSHSNEQCLYVLHGYPPSTNDISFDNALTTELLLSHKDRRTSGGYYIRWNGKGIVINPGVNFLEHFHRQGLHIRDIDYVIVTNANPETYADIKEIYELNYQLNNANSELQIIHYFLSQKAYQTLAPALKPHFKQERDTVRCLELFLDSPEVEKLELSEGITLHYFPIAGQTNHVQDLMPKSEKAHIPASLGIRFDLTTSEHGHDSKTVRLGYIAGAPWSPLLAHHLGQCDILIAGFGSTNANDYGKLKYNETCLGYFGSYSLLEEVHPHLFLSSEYNGNQGDIRIEVIKLMRQEYARTYPNARQMPAILPADPTLFVDLQTLNIQCSITKAQILPAHVRIVKAQASFGSLRYLSPDCCA